jgi:hypothetical protein
MSGPGVTFTVSVVAALLSPSSLASWLADSPAANSVTVPAAHGAVYSN